MEIIKMSQIKVGVIGVTGRGGIAKHWHDPEGRSVVSAGMDTSAEALERFKEQINREAFLTKDIDELH